MKSLMDDNTRFEFESANDASRLLCRLPADSHEGQEWLSRIHYRVAQRILSIVGSLGQ